MHRLSRESFAHVRTKGDFICHLKSLRAFVAESVLHKFPMDVIREETEFVIKNTSAGTLQRVQQLAEVFAAYAEGNTLFPPFPSRTNLTMCTLTCM